MQAPKLSSDLRSTFHTCFHTCLFARLSVATPLQIHISINQQSNLPGYHRLSISNDTLDAGFFLCTTKPDGTAINDPVPLFADFSAGESSNNTFSLRPKVQGSFFKRVLLLRR